MDLVRGVGIPDDQLSVLRGRYQVSPVRRPVHGVDLGEMALEGFPGLHHLVLGQGLLLRFREIGHCSVRISKPSRLRPSGQSVDAP